MVSACCNRVVTAHFALLVTIVESATYSRLNAGSLCSDYKIDDVVSQNECFVVAAGQLGLTGIPTLAVDGLGFSGCVYNTEGNYLMYGTSSDDGLVLSVWEYICNGIPTTTTTTTTTPGPTTTRLVIDYLAGYSLIDHFETCADYKIFDVPTAQECFTEALPYLGIVDVAPIALDGLGFTGCVYNTASLRVLFSVTTGVSGTTSGFFKYICKGTATTTTTTTTVTTTTVTTSTSTVTTTTTTTTSVTTSTSTRTTSTATTSTVTSSTSTMTTTTETGSSSSTTTTTITTSTTTTSTTFTVSTSTLTTMTTTYTPFAGFVADDPLTFYGGITQKFWMPEQELVPLLQTDELRLLGAASSHGTEEQWITRLVVTGPAGEPVFQVAIRNDVASFSKDTTPSDSFKTLNITLDWLGGLPLKALPPLDAYAYQWGSVVFAFARVPKLKVGKAPSEMVVADGTSARVVIMSTPAGGFEGAHAHLAAEYAHLDFVLHMKERDTCHGILPELWGLRPISNSTSAMLRAYP
mmetsp:Transcript_3650/g.10022  ORF Transcript_3650/g.10022 Transcript_3650/m.10022 type:complete len:522 (-) Transcript_3650:77-1642(-)